MEEKNYGNKWIFASIMCIILIGVDQITKLIALNNLKPIGSITVIQGFMDFTFVENRGVAFGMFSGKMWLILSVTTIISLGLVWYYGRLPKTAEYFWVRKSLILIFSGAIGNIIDRTFRGYVVDFLEFTFFQWPVFNMADCYVVVGAVVLMILIIFVIEEDTKDIEKEEKGE